MLIARLRSSALYPAFAGLLLMANLAQPANGQGEDKKSTDEPRAGEERSFEIAAGVKMVFCWIPAGKATLGSPEAEKGRQGDYTEMEHEFETKGFWLGKYPVTQGEWKAVMGNNPSSFRPDGRYKATLREDGIADTSRFPVETVSWNDCQKFLEKVNKRDGRKKVFGVAGEFALPKQDEWEYACRGGRGNKLPFYFGKELNGTQANCDGNRPYGTDRKGAYYRRTTEVGFYAKEAPHPWGLCDMHGNVGQWCDNLFYPLFKDVLKGRVIRGGSWLSSPMYCRSASRFMEEPESAASTHGFRVCLRPEK